MVEQPVWTDEAAMVAALRPLLGEDPGTLQFFRSGWDSVAIAARERIFKFPRHQRALAALRREAAILAFVGPVSPVPVPRLVLHAGERPFSEHAAIPGEHLLAAQYDGLAPARRQALAEALAAFHAATHSLDVGQLTAAGAGPVEAWSPPEIVERHAVPALPAPARQRAAAIIAAYAALPPDPYGMVYGHFDAHGWNMAFDHSAGRLNGIYDFADSGIGPLHRDFVCSAFISWDLTQRLLAGYEAQTGRALDRQRVHTLIGYHRLWELAAAVQAGGEVDEMVQAAQGWLDRQ